MTNEEALAHFKNHEYMTDFSWQDEMSEVAISAIEKQIPKRPIKDLEPFYRLGEPYHDWLCPTCNEWLTYECDTQRTSIHHCSCGQALDWEWRDKE